MEISVVICTYNPRHDYLLRVLDSLKNQTLPSDQWECLVVDNSSTVPVQNSIIAAMPAARIVVEPMQGLSHARRRGFQEAKGRLIVNLDDDVVLDRDYLKNVIQLDEAYPNIGVFGCQLSAEFEHSPTKPIAEYYAAERIIKRDTWSNDPEHFASLPWGAGSVVRRDVAKAYVAKLVADDRLSSLGRKGGELLACEDNDIAFTACEIGQGQGVFVSLHLTHLIPSNKMTDEFYLRNTAGASYSSVVFNFLRLQKLPRKFTLMGRLNRLYRFYSSSKRRREIMLAVERSERAALIDMAKWGWIP